MPLSAADHAVRAEGIGASDTGAVLGVNPWRRPIDVWLRLTGRAEPQTGESFAARLGNLIEPVVLRLWELEHPGWHVHQPRVVWGTEANTQRHPDAPYVLATPDGVASASETPPGLTGVDGGAELALVEAKNVGYRLLHHWEDNDAPVYYQVQVLQQMAVTGIHRGDLAGLLGGAEFRALPVTWEDEVWDEIMDALARFWFDHVLGDSPPPIDGSNGWTRWLERRLPSRLGKVIAANAEAEALAGCIRDAKARIEVAEQEVETARQALMVLCGEHRGLRGEAWTASWSKPGSKTSWADVAKALGSGLPPEVIAAHTQTTPRRFAVRYAGDKD